MNFLNKKEQVFDFQLTPYGKMKLSKGRFKPQFYSFFDDNIIYDLEYAGRQEEQNDTHTRIKQETQYLGTQVAFKEILGESVIDGGYIMDDIYELDNNKLTSRGMIGDARTLAESNNLCPAIKIVSYGNSIDTNTISQIEEDTGYQITQINLSASYFLESKSINDPITISFDEMTDVVSKTSTFSDNRYIQIDPNHPLFYIEELNTELLTENFTIEVFKEYSDTGGTSYKRLYFDNRKSNIKDGFLDPNYVEKGSVSYSPSSVEYFFSIRKDKEVPEKIACKFMNDFNKNSYLIDIDFVCDKQSTDGVYYDIYGAEIGDPEVCQD